MRSRAAKSIVCHDVAAHEPTAAAATIVYLALIAFLPVPAAKPGEF